MQFSKKYWVGGMAPKENGTFQLREDTFDIHIEGSLDVQKGALLLPVHYETRPYLPKRKMEKQAVGQEQYFAKRERFKKEIHQRIRSLEREDMTPYHGSNQMVRVKVPIHNHMTVKEWKEELVDYLSILSNQVDEALVAMKTRES